MTDEKTFRTVLKNEKQQKGVLIYDRTGKVEGILAPGRKKVIESWNPEALYAPYSEVIFRDNDVVETVPNPEYPAPKSKWTLTVINKNGGPCEHRIIGRREVCLPLGLPRTFEIDATSEQAVYSRMEIVRVMARSEVENASFPEYTTFAPIVKDKFYDRPESELKELGAELDKLTGS